MTQQTERQLILDALEKTHWVASQAARLLGTTRRILKYKMDQLGIKKEGLAPETSEKEEVQP